MTAPTLLDRRTVRAGAVVAAALLALLLWAAARVLGLEPLAPGMGEQPPMPLPATHVAASSVVGGLAAWAALAVAERWTRRPRRWWLATASAGLLLSLGGPLSGVGPTAAQRGLLVTLHVAVAVAAVGVMWPTVSRRRAAARASAATSDPVPEVQP